MAEHQPANWNIFCIVVNEKSPFSVEIQPNATVDALKKAIKTAKQPEFDRFAADRLILYLVNLPKDGNLAKKMEQPITIEPRTALKSTKHVGDLLPNDPTKETVYILVQTPDTLPQTGLKRGPTEEGSDILTPLAKKPRLHKQDITYELVQKWSRPMPEQALNLRNLRICLQRPLAEDEKIPISQDTFDHLTMISSNQDSVSGREDKGATPAETLFVTAIERKPPPSGPEDAFHGTWEDNIGWILKFLLPEGVPIRNSNRNSSTALMRPDYGFLVKGHCAVRGEEKGTDSLGDPEQELVEKLYKWTYQPLPFILGYHAIATDVQFVAITEPPSKIEPLLNYDLRFKRERVANVVHLIRLTGVVACMAQKLHRRNTPEYTEFKREGDLVRIHVGPVVRKEFRHPDAVNRVSKLVEIYDLLKAKQVPNVDTLDRANKAANPPYVQLSPVGHDVLPRSGSESLNSIVCVLEALKVLHSVSPFFISRHFQAMHSGPNPVYHRDIRNSNIIKRFDGTGWFLIDWSDATTTPTHAAMHLTVSEHSPAVRQDGHGAEVDIWGIGRYLEDLASRLTCGIAKRDEVKQMALRWIGDPATSAEATLHEINAKRDLFVAPAAPSS